MLLYRVIFVFNTYLMLFPMFLINKGITLESLFMLLKVDVPSLACKIISYLIYIAIPILTTYLCCKSFKKLDKADIKKDDIAHKESVGSSFLINFFACIFIALSVNNIFALIIIYLLITCLGVFAETYLNNPICYLFGYKYYFVTVKNVKIIVMSKKDVNPWNDVEFKKLARINNFTYIDIE